MKRLLDWWSVHFLFAELVVALGAMLAFGAWQATPGGGRAAAATLADNRGAVYGALTSLFGTLLGFTLAAMAIVLGYASDNRLRLVRESQHYPTLWRVFIAATRAMALATGVALLALVLDRDRAPSPLILDLVVGATALATLRLARVMWVFERIIRLITERHAGANEAQD
jgi:hypothetical protein